MQHKVICQFCNVWPTSVPGGGGDNGSSLCVGGDGGAGG